MKCMSPGVFLMAACTLVAADDTSILPFEARAVAGFHQAGASSSENTQNFFFDFFAERPFGSGAVYESRVGLWGQVRIGSTPQQISAPVSQFVTDFATQIGNVPVNQLAQSGEFLTGFEILPYFSTAKRDWFRWGYKSDPKTYDNKDRIRTLSFVAFFGANGAFSDPVASARVFKAVSPASPQFGNFVADFPDFANPAFSSKAQFLALVPPDRERFFRQYGGGIRFASYHPTSPADPPSMFTATIGQDQSITGGRYHGAVFKADAFYPLPIPTRKDIRFLFLFGTVNLAVQRPTNKVPLAMQLVSQPCITGDNTQVSGTNCNVKPYADNVAVYAIPSARDTYRIGFGIDLVALLNTWSTKTPAPAP
jgi:hypothetical protein